MKGEEKLNTKNTILALLMAILALTACEGGSGGPAPPPTPPAKDTAVKLYTYPSGAQWIAAPPGTAAALSEVKILADSQLYSTTALRDGSIKYRFNATGLRTISIEYMLAGGGKRNIRPDTFVVADNLTHDFLTLGMAPNDFYFYGGKCYVLNTMDNNLAAYDATTFSPAGGMSFPTGASPSYLFVRDGLGVVACNGNNRIYAFNPDDGSELWSVLIPADGAQFLGPGRPFADQDRIYVPLANIREFGMPGESTFYNQAQIAVINIASKALERKVTLNGFNAVEVISLGGGLLAICQAGTISFDEGYVPFAETSTFIEVYDIPEQAVTRTINLGFVGGGKMLYDSERERLLVGSLVNGRIYQINAETWRIERGMLNPIDLTSGLTFVSSMALYGNSLLVASFNEDLIYALDAEEYAVNAWPLPEPLPLEQEPRFLAGPQAIHYDAAANRMLILEGLANRITEFRFPALPD